MEEGTGLNPDRASGIGPVDDDRRSKRLPASDQGDVLDLERMLRVMNKHGASDLHLKVGNPPILRIQGKVRRFEAETLDDDRIRSLIEPFLTPPQQLDVERGRDLDFALSISGLGRYRINAFLQRGALSLAIRRVNTEIPSFEDLHLKADAMRRIAALRQGLVIVAGITGSGKSTTLAATIDYINTRRRCHIVTIEDPIEYLYTDKRAFVNQREVGIDVDSFTAALKSVVRQDPDVILIGELRDADTFETALTAAETGHLVFGTVHASSVAQSIGRVIDMFPADRERQLRSQLRFNLQAVICQKLLPAKDEALGLVPAQEILLATPTVQKLIADGEDKKLETVIRGGRDEGLQDFNSSLLELHKQGLISEKTALESSPNPEQLQMNLKGIFLGDDRQIVK